MKITLGEKFEGTIGNIRGLIAGAISLDKKISRRIIAKIKVKRILDKIIIGNDTIDVDSLVSFVQFGRGRKRCPDQREIAKKHRSLLMKALYSTILRRLRDGYISPDIIEKMVKDRIDSEFFSRVKNQGRILQKISPLAARVRTDQSDQKCNLVCQGCYSNSTREKRPGPGLGDAQKDNL